MKIEAGNNSLEIIIKERSYPDSNDYWDGNWLNACVILCLNGLKSSYSMFLRPTDFLKFLKCSSDLKSRTSVWEFNTMECCLEFSITVNDDRASFKGFVRNQPHHDEDEFEFDSDYISALNFILEANDILNEYPMK